MPKIQPYKVILLSTAHMTAGDNHLLTESTSCLYVSCRWGVRLAHPGLPPCPLVVDPLPVGFMVTLPDDIDACLEDIRSWGLSEPFISVLMFCAMLKVDKIEFHANGHIIDELPTHEWD